jgi:2-polyprenyl-3-methyl-5-hydroxy-6-metoxy-1,4-benzoquinol methylase
MQHESTRSLGPASGSAASCNNCGASESDELFAAGRAQKHRIVQCRNCGLMYASPLAASNLEGYLVSSEHAAPFNDDSPGVRRSRDKLPDYIAIEPVLAELLPARGRIIEVGAYSGLLLEHFRRAGWSVLGIEPDGRGVEYASRRFGIEVRQGTLESVTLESESAAAVVMLHVIEHMDDPASAVRAVARLLRPGGIFVIETPTYDSLAYRLLGRRERSISCDGHIYFYTERTLSALLTQGGFELIRIERVGRTITLARLLWNLGVMSKSTWLQGALGKLSERAGLIHKHMYMNANDMVRVYAKRRAV